MIFRKNVLMDNELGFLRANEDGDEGRLKHAAGRHVSNFGRKYHLDGLLVILLLVQEVAMFAL